MLDSGGALCKCMKIQEMRSGILHLAKKMDDERPENPFEILAADPAPHRPVVAAALQRPPTTQCELDAPRWSVVSFVKSEAHSLTYPEASVLMAELDKKGLAGLCIVTDEAAAKVK